MYVIHCAHVGIDSIWSKQSAHQNKNHHEKEHDKHGLLHGRRVISDCHPHTRHRKHKKQSRQINGAGRTFGESP